MGRGGRLIESCLHDFFLDFGKNAFWAPCRALDSGPPQAPIFRNYDRPGLNIFINKISNKRARNQLLQGYPFTVALSHNNNSPSQ